MKMSVLSFTCSAVDFQNSPKASSKHLPKGKLLIPLGRSLECIYFQASQRLSSVDWIIELSVQFTRPDAGMWIDIAEKKLQQVFVFQQNFSFSCCW